MEVAARRVVPKTIQTAEHFLNLSKERKDRKEK
jgi:hypothetical protein